MNDFRSLMDSFVREELSGNDSMKRASGTVVSIVPNTDGGKAIVNVMNRKLTLLNKTGENLEVDDVVWVHYWDSIANGYIALRNGLPNSRAEGSMQINTAVVMTETQAQPLTVADTVINVDYQNHLTAKYGNPRNSIIASELPVYVSNFTSTTTIAEMFDEMAEIPVSILSVERHIDLIDYHFYSVINGTFDTTADSWGLTSIVIETYPNSGGTGYDATYYYCGTQMYDENGNAKTVKKFEDLGLCFISNQYVGGAPNTDYPYGYAICRVINVGKYLDNGELKTVISRISSSTIKIPFGSQAEYDYAVNVQTRSSLHIG